MVRQTKKTPSEKKFLFMSGQRRRARVVEADRKVTVTQIATHYISGMLKSMSETNFCQGFWIGYSSRIPISKKKSNKYLIKC